MLKNQIKNSQSEFDDKESSQKSNPPKQNPDQFQNLEEIQQPSYNLANFYQFDQFNLSIKTDKPSLKFSVCKSSLEKFLTYFCLLTLLFIGWYLFIFDRISNCPNKFVITHIWLGQLSKMPRKYTNYLNKCQKNVKLLGNQDLPSYIQKWNYLQPDHPIGPQNFPQTIADKADLLRKLYLYFESGTYADFDTEIDEECFEDIITNEIIFTNYWGIEGGIKIPEQNFMRVLKKYNPAMKRMILTQLSETHSQKDNRWNECRIKPCFIINCQEHAYDRSWE